MFRIINSIVKTIVKQNVIAVCMTLSAESYVFVNI